LTIALTHFDISLDGVIDALSPTSDVLGDPRFASLVNFNPNAAERAAVCDRGTFYGDLNSCLTSAVPIVDGRSLNVSRVRTAGYDVAAKYVLSTSAGQLEIGLNGTYMSQFAVALASVTPLTNLVNTDHNPLKIRARFSLEYRWAALDAVAFVNYAGKY